jgi:hypothetical protein
MADDFAAGAGGGALVMFLLAVIFFVSACEPHYVESGRNDGADRACKQMGYETGRVDGNWRVVCESTTRTTVELGAK